MSKKTLYFEEAERLYVVEQLNLTEVSKRIPLSERTLQKWKSEGDWERKRANFLQQKQSLHSELYGFTAELLEKVRNDIKEGKDPQGGQLYTLTKLLSQLTKAKEYEDAVAAQETPEQKSKGIDEETLRIIESEVFGH